MKKEKRTGICINYGMGTGFVLMILSKVLGDPEMRLAQIGAWVVVLSLVAGVLNEMYGKDK